MEHCGYGVEDQSYVMEVELDRGYQLVRRRKPFDPVPPSGGLKKSGSRGDVQTAYGFEDDGRAREKRQRARAASFGGNGYF